MPYPEGILERLPAELRSCRSMRWQVRALRRIGTRDPGAGEGGADQGPRPKLRPH